MGRLLRFRRRGGEPWPRGVPSDARSDPLFPSDARPAEDPPPGKAPDPDRERRRRFLHGVVGLFLATLFVAGSVEALVGNHGYFAVRRSREELASLKAAVERKQIQVMELRQAVDRLKNDPHAIERIAREELGFVKPGEITFLLPREENCVPGGGLALPPPAVKKAPAAKPDVPRD
ncbi:MAG: septum formation initiator family protein [Acidobacteriia bacterium]|nr:septum formation initiator family protein [Terriglobia bacterium]